LNRRKLLPGIAVLMLPLMIGSSSPAVATVESGSAASPTPSLTRAGDDGVLGLAGLLPVRRPPHDFAQPNAATGSIDHPLLPSECKTRFGSTGVRTGSSAT
jgi:hypothetical protein